MQAFSHRIYEKQFAQAQQLMERLYTEYLYAGAPAGTEAMRQSAVDNLLADALRAALPEARAAQEVRALTAAGPPHAQRRQAQHALARSGTGRRARAPRTRSPWPCAPSASSTKILQTR